MQYGAVKYDIYTRQVPSKDVTFLYDISIAKANTGAC